MEFNKKEIISVINRIFEKNGLSALLSAKKAEDLAALTEFLISENEKYNLTAITEPSRIALNHYADCAMLAKELPSGARIVDVGCGAGFPTLPIAILRPDVRITAIDSTAKRCAFVGSAATLLGLENVTVTVARAEDAAREGALRESFDFATARAVAEMRILSELCLPFVRVGGKFIAMKGKNAENELRDAKRAIAMLGGRLSAVKAVSLIGEGEELSHPLIFIDKASRTPAAYPRAYAQISKKPL